MDFRKNNKGFSLVEMIVVIGIIGIIGGISVTLLGHIRHANNEKTVQSISMALSKQQAQTLSKNNRPYLYIYEVDGGFYLCLSDKDVNEKDASFMTKAAGKELGVGFEVYRNSADDANKVGGDSVIKMVYKRDGSFDTTKSNCQTVVVKTKAVTTSIKMIEASGKHIISMN